MLCFSPDRLHKTIYTTVTRAASDIRKSPSKALSCESFSPDCSGEHASGKRQRGQPLISAPEGDGANKSGEQYTTATMEKCLLAGAGTNRRHSPGCSELLGSAGSPQINYPHLLRSEGMGGSFPESPSNLFLVFGELAPVPVTLRRQAGKSQQPRLAVWMLVGGELTAQESVLGTADMFKWRGRSQTKMLASEAWKLHRASPAPRTSPATSHGDAGAACTVGTGVGEGKKKGPSPPASLGGAGWPFPG